MGIKIAIYGGIGSGKSSVSQIIRESGYTVLDCDEIYRQEVLCDKAFQELLIDKFGSEIVEGDRVNTRALGAKVYNDIILKNWLDNVAHPLILQKLSDKMDGREIVFAEVPLLY
ncbi:MAG: dephospho-CoA kinase, partial [Clostridia bacterium]|nr:dephospho-CoA kinase [Clostridia bacterium]